MAHIKKIVKNFFKKGGESGKNQPTQFQDVLYSFSNQDCVVLEDVWIHRTMEQTRKPGNWPKQIHSNEFPQRCKNNNGESIAF